MALKYALLCSLHEEPATGYELTRRFRDRMGNVWNASHQQIYRELAKLEADGKLRVEAIPQSGKPDRKLYRVTPQGEADLAEWVNTPAERPSTRDPLLLKLFAGDLWSDEVLSEELAACRDRWRAQLSRYHAIEAHYFSDPSTLSRHYRLQYLSLRRGIRAMEDWLAWANEVEALLGIGVESV